MTVGEPPRDSTSSATTLATEPASVEHADQRPPALIPAFRALFRALSEGEVEADGVVERGQEAGGEAAGARPDPLDPDGADLLGMGFRRAGQATRLRRQHDLERGQLLGLARDRHDRHRAPADAPGGAVRTVV